MGIHKTRGYSYHCDTGSQESWLRLNYAFHFNGQSDSSLKRIIPEPRVPSRGSQARGTRLADHVTNVFSPQEGRPWVRGWGKGSLAFSQPKISNKSVTQGSPGLQATHTGQWGHDPHGRSSHTTGVCDEQSRSRSLRSSGRNARLWDNPLPEARNPG